MASDLISTLRQGPVVPLVQSNDQAEAVEISRALLAGGLNVLEVVLRTDEAFACLGAICKAFPEAHVGAGTVLSSEHVEKAVDQGATFIVSPGLTESVVTCSHEKNVPILPGVATATELQNAWNMGLRTVKFFPASLAGGSKMLKALSSVFRDVEFMPTDGISPTNLTEYLAVPAVLACGGSWLTPKEAVASGEFDKITGLAKEALAIANAARTL